MAKIIAEPGGGPARMAALQATGILDTPREQDFDDIVDYVARLCEAPISLISLVETDRQWFKAAHGFDEPETPIEQSICAHALARGTFLEIPDTAKDPRTARNPLCLGPNAIRFYAGALLVLDSGIAIGTLCVLDRRPRTLTPFQRETITLLARQVVRQIELREALSLQEHLRREIDHRVKNSLQMVASYLRLRRRDAGREAADILTQAEQQVASIVALHSELTVTGSTGQLDIADYIGHVVALIAETLPERVSISADLAPLRCRSDTAAAAGLIVNEFTANSVKHGFPEGQTGTISVTGRRLCDRYVLTIADDGVGALTSDGSGLGLAIIDAAALQLQAELTRPAVASGTAIEVAFPTAPAPNDLGEVV